MVSDKYSSKEISKMKMNTVLHGHTKVLGSSIKGGFFGGTRRLSPFVRCTVMKIVDQTVQATSGIPAASRRETPLGIGSSCPAGTFTFSAYPPPPSTAHTCIHSSRLVFPTIKHPVT
jgi:hypothetical protein